MSIKESLPEKTFEDQLLSVFDNVELEVKDSINSIEDVYKENTYHGIIYRNKYKFFSLWESCFVVEPNEFEDIIYNAFKSHAFCLNVDYANKDIEDTFKKIVSKTFILDNEDQEKKYTYFKSMVNAMNRIIEDPEIKYSKSLFQIALLNEFDLYQIKKPESKQKEMLMYFSNNINQDSPNNIELSKLYKDGGSDDTSNSFLNFLMILTMFNGDEEDNFKNLMWEDFNNTNKVEFISSFKRRLEDYHCKNINFNVMNKDILLKNIPLEYLKGMRVLFKGKNKIKDGLTDFLIPLTSREEHVEMFLSSVINDLLSAKTVAIEKKYFPNAIYEIEMKHLEKIFNKEAAYLFCTVSDLLIKDNFMFKTLGSDYPFFEPGAEKDSVFMYEMTDHILKAFDINKIKEEKKMLKREFSTISIPKKLIKRI